LKLKKINDSGNNLNAICNEIYLNINLQKENNQEYKIFLYNCTFL